MKVYYRCVAESRLWGKVTENIEGCMYVRLWECDECGYKAER